MALLSALATEIMIPVCALVGITFSYYLVWWLVKLRINDLDDRNDDRNDARGRFFLDWTLPDRIKRILRVNSLYFIEVLCRMGLSHDAGAQDFITHKAQYDRTMRNISTGAKVFLFMECRYGGVFMVAFAILIFLCLGSVEGFSTQSQPCRLDPSNMCKPALATAIFSAVSFLLGAFTSFLHGSIGMRIVINANARTASEKKKDVSEAFFSAFTSGALMGFLIAANGLLVLYIAINLFKLYYGNDWEGLLEAIAGYGLGASSMALLGRGTGVIYAKAADVCCNIAKSSHLVPLLVPAAVSFHVGDIVGDIAGAGTDLFVSYVESSCAALVVASISSFGNDHNFTALCYPLLLSSMGILVCLMTTLFTFSFSIIEDVKEIKRALRKQLIISTILMTFGIVIVSWIALPSSFTVYNFGSHKVVKNWQLCFCVGVGLWAGLIIEFITISCTNDEISRVQEFAAEGVGFGLAFVNIPIFAFLSILLSYRIASVYGIAVAAVGMLSTIATRLAINAYSPISDNAKRVTEMTKTRDPRAMLFSSNTRVTIGKVFPIESTSLVSMALFGAFVSRAAISPVDVLTPKVFMGSIVGAMLPKWFSAMTMKRVGPAALDMAKGIFRDSVSLGKCFVDPIDASFMGMIRAVALVMLTPLIVGTFLGVEMLSGVLAGSLGSVVRIAISASNTRGAWEEAKEYVRAGASAYAKTHYDEESMIHEAVDKADTIRDPLKDFSGPPLNILVQLMAVESLVFAPFFTTHGGLLFKIF